MPLDHDPPIHLLEDGYQRGEALHHEAEVLGSGAVRLLGEHDEEEVAHPVPGAGANVVGVSGDSRLTPTGGGRDHPLPLGEIGRSYPEARPSDGPSRTISIPAKVDDFETLQPDPLDKSNQILLPIPLHAPNTDGDPPVLVLMNCLPSSLDIEANLATLPLALVDPV